MAKNEKSKPRRGTTIDVGALMDHAACVQIGKTLLEAVRLAAKENKEVDVTITIKEASE